MLSHEVLYIHPYGHLNDLVVPSGALTCMNSLTAPKLGRYAFEVSDAEIRAARVVALDVHWALGITGFEPVVRHIRVTNPQAHIVVGGITAGHYARDLLERYPIDFVVRGDSELSFAQLVGALLDRREPDAIPNVFRRGAGVPVFRRMTEAEFDATDCISADWFPTYESRMVAIIPTLPGQQQPSEAQREQLGSWPLVTLLRHRSVNTTSWRACAAACSSASTAPGGWDSGKCATTPKATSRPICNMPWSPGTRRSG